MPDAAHMVDSAAATKVELEIPCECSSLCRAEHGDCGCTRAAELWVIMHDVFDDCLKHEGGVLSVYLCRACWDPIAAEFNRKLRVAASSRILRLECLSCHLHLYRWSDIVYRVVGIGGTKR